MDSDQEEIGDHITQLKNKIAKHIDRGESLRPRRGEMERQKANLEKQIAVHQNNLVALGCDQTEIITELDETKGNCDPAMLNLILGTWKSEFGPVTFTGSCGNITGYWQQEASYRGEITGGSLESDIRTLTISYKQSWNNITNGKAVFKLSADGKTLNGRYTGGGGNGIWNLIK